MDFNKSNDKFELKTFMANVRSGNIVRLIESTQLQFEEKCTYLTQKLKKSEEEMRRKLLILQQNSHLIENFQKQLQELSDQNTELLGQQQVIKEENENLNALLQCSEDKFAQLDILYDQQISDLSNRNSALEQELGSLECNQEQYIGQFDKAQRDFNEMLTKAEQRHADLLNELGNLEVQKTTENEKLKNELSELKNVLNQKTIDYEERIRDLKSSLSSTLGTNKEINDLEKQIETLNNERKADQKAFDIEKSRVVNSNEVLKVTVEDLKRKLSTKEKEVEEVYLKFKKITRLSNSTTNAQDSMHSSNFPSRKHGSHDDPTPFDYDSTDSDASSVSIYKNPKFRRLSPDSEENRAPKTQFRAPSFGFKNRILKQLDDIEIPESPIVSSSAFGNNEQKL